jgi:glycosyltransferase involved in cell wall biosynthesis
MRVCFAVLHYDRRVVGPSVEAYLDQVEIHRELPREVALLGAEVDVVHLYPYRARAEAGQVRHHFVPAEPAARWLARAIALPGSRDAVVYEAALPAIKRIRELRPDVVHFHGLTLTWNLLLLACGLDRRIPLIAHFHGGAPARNALARLAQRAGIRRVSRFLFTTAEQAKPFVDALSLDPARVVELVETSTTFADQPRAIARRLTGMDGDPVFLWTGRLHPLKDPFTALRGFERITREWPSARLYLHYLSDELLPSLRAFVAERPPLAERVEFRGPVPHAALEAAYNSADFFLQASRREYSGYALLEALATGAVPVVTDIPSFRAITGDGKVGALFPRGDDVALARNALLINRADLPGLSQQVRRHFERALSFPAMARSLVRIYDEVIREKSRQSVLETSG